MNISMTYLASDGSDKYMQLNVYDYLGKEHDPLYQKIDRLDQEQSVEIDSSIVYHSKFGLYEISSPSFHNAYTSKVDCYKKICEILAD